MLASYLKRLLRLDLHAALLPKEVWQLRKGGNVLVNGHRRHQNNKLLENKLSREKGKHW